MLWLDDKEEIQDDQIIITQTYHQIAFFTHDIVNIVPFSREMATAYYLPECSERDCYGGSCVNKNKEECKFCKCQYKLEEILIDGFYVNDGDYIVTLQTGVRVPISDVLYHTVALMWEMSKRNKYQNEF